MKTFATKHNAQTAVIGRLYTPTESSKSRCTTTRMPPELTQIGSSPFRRSPATGTCWGVRTGRDGLGVVRGVSHSQLPARLSSLIRSATIDFPVDPRTEFSLDSQTGLSA